MYNKYMLYIINQKNMIGHTLPGPSLSNVTASH